jgi:SAM-dependent methyltransferase
MMPVKTIYDLTYFRSEALDPELNSPRVVVPIVISLVRPRSVVDVGCGAGHWLSEFQRLGVERVLGLDGAYVDPEWLIIPKSLFRAVDLSKPFRLNERFDLAVCLEVAEHLPETAATGLVDSLVNLSPVILFSAAIPMQGGTHHVNEQWPEYWRRLFQKQGYRMLDVIRKEIWKNAEVKFWYRQNTFLFVSESLIPSNSTFLNAADEADDLLLVRASTLKELLGLRSMLKAMPRSVWQFLIRRTQLSREGGRGRDGNL